MNNNARKKNETDSVLHILDRVDLRCYIQNLKFLTSNVALNDEEVGVLTTIQDITYQSTITLQEEVKTNPIAKLNAQGEILIAYNIFFFLLRRKKNRER